MYGIIGLLPGWMGWNMQQIVGPGWISFIVGCLVLIIALSPSLKLISLFPNSFVNHIRNMYQQMYHQPIWYYFIVGGIFNALLPCTMIFLALTASIVTASPLSGFLFMFYFGMGTMPALAAVHMSKAWYLQRFRSRAQSTSRIITLVLGVVLILRSLLPHHNHALSSTNKATSICKSISL